MQSQYISIFFKKCWVGISLAVQWLGLCAFTAEGPVQSLVKELRSHKAFSMAQKKKKKKKFFKGTRYLISTTIKKKKETRH